MMEVTFDAPYNSKGDRTYDGRAVIESIGADGVVLAFAVTPDAGARHVTLSKLGWTPTFKIGAQVWLTANPSIALTPSGVSLPFHQPWALAVRDHEDGTLLLGAASGAQLDSAIFAALPFTLTPGVVGCSAEGPDPICPSGPSIQVSYSSIVVTGDSAVTIADSQTDSVQAQGATYDVRVRADTITVPQSNKMECYDYDPTTKGGFALDARARDLGARALSLPLGNPPSCVPGAARANGSPSSLPTRFTSTIRFSTAENPPMGDCCSKRASSKRFKSGNLRHRSASRS